MNIINRSKLIELLMSHRSGVVEQLTSRAVDEFVRYLNEQADVIAEEAMNGNYFRLHPIDVRRGIDKWANQKLKGTLHVEIL